MFSLTSDEKRSIIAACALVIDEDRMSRAAFSDEKAPDYAYGLHTAKTLAAIGQLFAVIAAIEVKEASDGQEEPPF